MLVVFGFGSATFFCIAKNKNKLCVSDEIFATVIIVSCIIGVFGLLLSILSGMLVI
jgi:hypothetical protein